MADHEAGHGYGVYYYFFFSIVFFWFVCEDEVISITEMFTWWIIKQGKAPFKGWTHFWPEPLAFCTTPHPTFSVLCLVMMILIKISIQHFWQDFLSIPSASYLASQRHVTSFTVQVGKFSGKHLEMLIKGSQNPNNKVGFPIAARAKNELLRTKF